MIQFSIVTNAFTMICFSETVCFLSKAVVIAILMILLVQFIASQEVCSVELPKSSLPPAVQRILNGKDLKDSLRCPYGGFQDLIVLITVI